eukprot:SAG31_NODE_45754_length_257_cov_0.987342_1_plen_54_part_10
MAILACPSFAIARQANKSDIEFPHARTYTMSTAHILSGPSSSPGMMCDQLHRYT